MRDLSSTNLQAAAHLAREQDPYPDERPDPSEYMDEPVNLPAATRRCWDCGVGWGPCLCTREYQAWEAEQERAEDDEPAVADEGAA